MGSVTSDASGPTSRLRLLVVLTTVAVVLALTLMAGRAYDRDQNQVNTDNLVTQLCEGTPDC